MANIGVRACRPIPKGMFICSYSGEVITEAEAEHRGEEYDKKVSKSHKLDSDDRALHIFSIWTFSAILRTMPLIPARRKQMGICFRWTQCIMAMYLGFSTTLAIPISQSTRLFVMVICGYTILPYFPSNPSNPTRSYASITKRRRESK
jgi:hypothetical protein